MATEIWPVSSRQIAGKVHSSDLDKDVVPSSSQGQMMIGGEGSTQWKGSGGVALQGRGTGQSAPLVLGGKGYKVVGARCTSQTAEAENL
jgi:hypothetical protein